MSKIKGTMIATKKLDATGKKILSDLQENKLTDKEISNKYKVSLEVVKVIKKYHFTAKDREIADAAKENIVVEKINKSTDKNCKVKESKKNVSKNVSGKSNAPTKVDMTDDLKLSIATDIESGYRYEDIREKYGVANKTIANIKREFGLKMKGNGINTETKNIDVKTVGKTDDETVVNVDNNKDKEPVENTATIKTKQEKVVTLGSIKEPIIDDRFTDLSKISMNFTKATKPVVDMVVGVIKDDCADKYVKDFIFEDTEYPSKYQFYNQYEYASDWIKKNIKFSATGEPMQKVILHLSSIQSYNLSVIKALEYNKINTDVKIYNAETDRYNNLTLFHMFDSDNSIDKSYIEPYLRNSDSVYLYGVNKSSDILPHFYVISTIETRGERSKRYSYMFNSERAAWEYFRIIVKIINESTNNFKVFLDECVCDDNSLKQIVMRATKLASSFNDK